MQCKLAAFFGPKGVISRLQIVQGHLYGQRLPGFWMLEPSCGVVDYSLSAGRIREHFLLWLNQLDV
jgi:hypothetical protein